MLTTLIVIMLCMAVGTIVRESFQFAGDHFVTALLGFNLGVEIGRSACCFGTWWPTGSVSSSCRQL
jgi:hypothetical protein